MDVDDIVLELIANYKGMSVSDLPPERSLQDIPIDSLDVVELIWEIEDKFEIEVPNNILDLAKIKTIGDVLEIVKRLSSEHQHDTQ